jgi:hypothetical protein
MRTLSGRLLVVVYDRPAVARRVRGEASLEVLQSGK